MFKTASSYFRVILSQRSKNASASQALNWLIGSFHKAASEIFWTQKKVKRVLLRKYKYNIKEQLVFTDNVFQAFAGNNFSF